MGKRHEGRTAESWAHEAQMLRRALDQSQDEARSARENWVQSDENLVAEVEEVDRLHHVIEEIARGRFAPPEPPELREAINALRNLYAKDGTDADLLASAAYEIREARRVRGPLTEVGEHASVIPLLVAGWTAHYRSGAEVLWQHPDGGDDRYTEASALALQRVAERDVT